MDKSWKKFDMYDRGSIPDTEVVYFARDLMSSLAPPEKEDPYALDFSEKKVKQIDVDPLVEPDTPVMERPEDHTKTKPYKPTSTTSAAPVKKAAATTSEAKSTVSSPTTETKPTATPTEPATPAKTEPAATESPA